ncbi:MAG: alpha-2-macroglobulin, partial [Lentisphaerae bacterium]|nr:alpha-2-macroglobulin [Lentisphaerota bacterium]
ESDAMEMRFPVYVHGQDTMIPVCGMVRPEETRAEVTVVVPEARRPESARLEVRFSPSLAMAMVDALPYLVAYPYGCTEQTLNRFLPTVLTQRVLQRLGVSLEEIRAHRSNLNAQELGAPAERAAQWRRGDPEPVFDEAAVAAMARDGVEALVAMQLGDGGWGWFSGWGERSSAHTTGTVVHGLQVALENDLAVPAEVLRRGVEWLRGYQSEQVRLLRHAEQDPPREPRKAYADNLDAMVYGVLADADVVDEAMREYLYRDRTRLSLYGLALYGLALQRQAQPEKLAMVLRNLSQFVERDAENQTAWLNLGRDNPWWCWYGSDIEAQAAYLKLLCAAEPRNEILPWIVKYLLNNRKHATYWNSTRDTALCVEAFADYLRTSGEDRPDMTVTLALDGKVRHEVTITPQNLFTIDNAMVIAGADLTTGEHRLTLTKTGRGPLYWNSYLSYFTLEDPIPRAGLEVRVERALYRLVRDDRQVATAGAQGQVLQQRAEHYRREPLGADGAVTSGDLIEVEMVVESKNDYEYIVLEDFKAAGTEPVDLRSGYNGNELGAYVEFRDERTAFFLQRLAQGRHSLSYRLRAETPGRFSALPATIRAMYAPELRGNSDENKLAIEDAPPAAR